MRILVAFFTFFGVVSFEAASSEEMVLAQIHGLSVQPDQGSLTSAPVVAVEEEEEEVLGPRQAFAKMKQDAGKACDAHVFRMTGMPAAQVFKAWKACVYAYNPK